MSAQLTLPVTLSDKACFENFWIGENTELVVALRQAAIDAETSLIYFYGVTGAGKSHLMFATFRFAQQHNKQSQYLSFKDSRLTPELLDNIDASQILCIDDVTAWAGDSTLEQALFGLFEKVRHSGGQLIVSANHSPEKSEIQLKDLVSRLSCGLVYSLQELDDEQRPLALKMRAEHRGLSVSKETLQYLIKRLPRDATMLFAFLDEIDRASLIEKRKITIPFLRKYL